MIVAVALAGVPVWRLTRPAAAAATVAPAVSSPVANSPDAKILPLDVEAVFAPAPTDFQIKNLDQTVLIGHGPQTRFTTRCPGNVPPDGVDFVVQARWPTSANGDTATGAARITIRFPDGRKMEKSFWASANGALTEVFTLPGAAQSPVDTP